MTSAAFTATRTTGPACSSLHGPLRGRNRGLRRVGVAVAGFLGGQLLDLVADGVFSGLVALLTG